MDHFKQSLEPHGEGFYSHDMEGDLFHPVSQSASQGSLSHVQMTPCVSNIKFNSPEATSISLRETVIRLRTDLEVLRSTHLLGEASCSHNFDTSYRVLGGGKKRFSSPISGTQGLKCHSKHLYTLRGIPGECPRLGSKQRQVLWQA